MRSESVLVPATAHSAHSNRACTEHAARLVLMRASAFAIGLYSLYWTLEGGRGAGASERYVWDQ